MSYFDVQRLPLSVYAIACDLLHEEDREYERLKAQRG